MQSRRRSRTAPILISGIKFLSNVMLGRNLIFDSKVTDFLLFAFLYYYLMDVTCSTLITELERGFIKEVEKKKSLCSISYQDDLAGKRFFNFQQLKC